MTWPRPLLPLTQTQPVWRRQGQRTLEQVLSSRSATPLMALAGQSLARLALALAPHARCVWVLAGPGHNGGDGLLAALALHGLGRTVHVSLLAPERALPAAVALALSQARQAGISVDLGFPEWPLPLGPLDLRIDALLGLGGQRPPVGDLLQAIHSLNQPGAPVLAVDVPSGLDADSGQPLGAPEDVVRADYTLTFLAPKPGLFMGMGRDACGQIWWDPLAEVPMVVPPEWPAADADLLPSAKSPPVAHAAHKGRHGDVAVVGGQGTGQGVGMAGAPVLAAQAALSAGAGRVWLALLGTPPSGWTCPPDVLRCTPAQLPITTSVVLAGCGGGRAMVGLMPTLLAQCPQLVLDADALNALAQDPWLQGLLDQRAQRGWHTVLTPHPLEAARLLGMQTPEVQNDRLGAAQALSVRWGVVVVLKGSGTVVSAPGDTPSIHTHGNGRLAIGGTGDVLAGLMAAAWAKGSSPLEAARLAVDRHGQCAEAWPTDQPLTASALAQRLSL